MSVLPVVEEWKPVPLWAGFYSVSDHGNVRTEPRVVERKNGGAYHVRSRQRKLPQTASGHVVLTFRSKDRIEHLYVHRIVYEAFVGPIPTGMEVRHLNGVPNDNRLSNLSIGTRTDQRYDDVRNGVHHESIKSTCHWGHAKEEPWSRITVTDRGVRHKCIPCEKARNRMYYHGISEAEAREFADKVAREMGTAP